MPDVIIQEGAVTIRRMEEKEPDIRLFLKWMTDPHTMKYWEGMTVHFTYEKVLSQYRENLRDHVEQCIILYQNEPIGFCQFCVLTAQNYDVPESLYRRFAGPSDTVYGIDIFIGEVSYRGRGVGTECLKALMKALFEKYGADLLMIDPKVHNARAIRCYHKCGFEDLLIVPHRELQDGVYHDSLIMGVKKASGIK